VPHRPPSLTNDGPRHIRVIWRRGAWLMRADRTSTQDVAGYAVARAADGAGTAQGHARLTARAARRDDDTTPGPWPLLGVVAYLVVVGMNRRATPLPLRGRWTAALSP